MLAFPQAFTVLKFEKGKRGRSCSCDSPALQRRIANALHSPENRKEYLFMVKCRRARFRSSHFTAEPCHTWAATWLPCRRMKSGFGHSRYVRYSFLLAPCTLVNPWCTLIRIFRSSLQSHRLRATEEHRKPCRSTFLEDFFH
jgi:hypothetical protein